MRAAPLTLTLGLTCAAAAGPATPSGPFVWPYPDGEPQPYRMTAAFDFDRSSGPRSRSKGVRASAAAIRPSNSPRWFRTLAAAAIAARASSSAP